MATAYSSLLGLALPVQGELPGQWGNEVNNYITNYLDASVAGGLSITADVTLTKTTGSALGATSSQYAILTCSPASVNIVVTAPAAYKIYVVNNTSASYTVTIRGAGPTTGVVLAALEKAVVAWNGTDFFKVATSATDGVSTFSAGSTGLTPSSATSGVVTLAGTLAVLNGGTGVTTSTGTTNVVLSNSPTLVTPVLGVATATSLQGIIGNVTPAAGTFTTLTTSSTVTVNGGTANGVAYLDASKVLTTGSALAFDGTFLTATRGITVNSSGVVTSGFYNGVNISGFDALGWSGSTTLAFGGYRASQWTQLDFYTGGSIRSTLSSTGLAVTGTLSATGTLSGGTSGTAYSFSGSAPATSLTLDSSGNLGIGTSSPAYKLDVDRGASNGIVARLGRTSGQALYVFADTTSVFMGSDTSLATSISFNETNDNIELYTNNTRRALLDSAGNLGLGVTPSDWSSASRPALQLPNGAALFTRSGSTFLGQNFFYNSSDTGTYIANGFATLYNQNSGQHQWFNAASGTAGNAAALTQAMTLDASGNLGIGTSSPARKLHVDGGGSATYIQLSNTASGSTNADGFQLTQDGANCGLINREAGYMSFDTSNTERARIDASGNLLVGKTSSGTTNIGVESRADGTFIVTKSGSTSATETMVVYSTGASALRFYVSMDGTVNATSIVITAISDERLKENVRDINTGLDAIMALKPRRFDWREGKGQDKKDVAGFIAQEFETVFPECVNTSKAGADGIEYKNINHETLIPTLVKAMQEQQALITQLTARITALETL